MSTTWWVAWYHIAIFQSPHTPREFQGLIRVWAIISFQVMELMATPTTLADQVKLCHALDQSRNVQTRKSQQAYQDRPQDSGKPALNGVFDNDIQSLSDEFRIHSAEQPRGFQSVPWHRKDHCQGTHAYGYLFCTSIEGILIEIDTDYLFSQTIDSLKQLQKGEKYICTRTVCTHCMEHECLSIPWHLSVTDNMLNGVFSMMAADYVSTWHALRNYVRYCSTEVIMEHKQVCICRELGINTTKAHR